MMYVGTKVRLIGDTGCLSTYGSLNSYFLSEEGVNSETRVPVIETDGRNHVVKLPSGYELRITDKDVV